VKGQILRVRATAGAVLPRRTVRGEGIYVIPRPHGEIAIGATSEERGFDTTVTAGAVLELLRDAWELLPGVAEAELVEAIAGLRHFWGPARFRGCGWPPATTATACCWPRSPRS